LKKAVHNYQKNYKAMLLKPSWDIFLPSLTPLLLGESGSQFHPDLNYEKVYTQASHLYRLRLSTQWILG